MRGINLIVLLLLLGAVTLTLHLQQGIYEDMTELRMDKHELQQEVNEKMQRLENTKDKLNEYEELQQEYKEILDVLELDTFNTTKYAPRDSRAVEGGCFEGDPNITASGQTVTEYRTAAAGPNVEFGTKVYIEGKGLYEVQDRGGAINDGDLDLAVNSIDEAIDWGRREKRAVVINQ